MTSDAIAYFSQALAGPLEPHGVEETAEIVSEPQLKACSPRGVCQCAVEGIVDTADMSDEFLLEAVVNFYSY